MGRRRDLFWAMKSNLQNPRGYDRAKDEWDIYHAIRRTILIVIVCAIPFVGGLIFGRLIYTTVF